MKMSIRDWLWAKWNGVCTKHLMRKEVYGTYIACPECRQERILKYETNLARICRLPK